MIEAPILAIFDFNKVFRSYLWG